MTLICIQHVITFISIAIIEPDRCNVNNVELISVPYYEDALKYEILTKLFSYQGIDFLSWNEKNNIRFKVGIMNTANQIFDKTQRANGWILCSPETAVVIKKPRFILVCVEIHRAKIKIDSI